MFSAFAAPSTFATGLNETGAGPTPRLSIMTSITWPSASVAIAGESGAPPAAPAWLAKASASNDERVVAVSDTEPATFMLRPVVAVAPPWITPTATAAPALTSGALTRASAECSAVETWSAETSRSPEMVIGAAPLVRFATVVLLVIIPASAAVTESKLEAPECASAVVP